MPEAPQISVIIPLLNEEESLPELIRWIDRVCTGNGFAYEALMIDDGSTDRSWEVIGQLKTEFPQVRGFKFLRNYGKSAALHTGFLHAKGEVVITMDADLQDSPDEIPALVSMVQHEGYHLVSGWKQKRHDPISKTIPSRFFNMVTRKVSGIKLNDFNCGLKAYQQQVVKTIEVYGEMHRYIPVIAKWHGFDKIGEKPVAHRARKYGTTKFGLERFINGFLDLLSITFVSKFGKKPMHFFGTLGIISFLAGFLFSAKILIEKIYISNILGQTPKRDVVEQPLFFLALVMLIIGVQLFLAGFVSEMVSNNNPNRGDYHVSETV